MVKEVKCRRTDFSVIRCIYIYICNESFVIECYCYFMFIQKYGLENRCKCITKICCYV